MMTVGAQLYTLREYTQTEKDLDFSLARVAEMGYRTVQISAIGPIAPKTVRSLCDRYGLSIVLTHTDPNRILHDTQRVIEEHDEMGCKYIGLGMMPQKYASPHWLSHFAEDFLPAARQIAAAGKLLMYHNHNIEFQKFNGKLVLDTLLESFAPEELGFTLDTYWVHLGGADVCAWLKKLQGRTPCIHLKDMAVRGWDPIMAPVGEGNLNFDAILETCQALGGVEYLLVEQDVCQTSPFDCLQSSFNYLHGKGLC